jgi:hypothetical protein
VVTLNNKYLDISLFFSFTAMTFIFCCGLKWQPDNSEL